MQRVHKCSQYWWKHKGFVHSLTRLLQHKPPCPMISSVWVPCCYSRCHSGQLGPWTDLQLPGEKLSKDTKNRNPKSTQGLSSSNAKQRKAYIVPQEYSISQQTATKQGKFTKRKSDNYSQYDAKSKKNTFPSKFNNGDLYKSSVSHLDAQEPKNPFEPRLTEKVNHDSLRKRVSFLGDAFDAEVDKIIAKGSNVTAADWATMESSLLDLKHFHKQWPTKVMKCLKTKVDQGGVDIVEITIIAKSLHGYTRDHENTVSVAMLGLLMAILGHCPDHHDAVFGYFEELQTRTDVLDSQLAQWAIEGLSKTASWAECLAILEDYGQFASPLTNHVSPVVEAAFHHQDAETGWRLLQHMGDIGLCPMKSTLTRLFTMANNQRDMGVKLLTLMRTYRWIPVEDTALAVYEFFKSNKKEHWMGQKSVIRSSGYCGHCQQHLDDCKPIPVGDFESMRRNFLEHSLIKNDVFLNSSPEELSRFTEFLSSCEPYTVVVDGLNVMLGLTRKPNHHQKILQLRTVIDFLSSGQHKVLVMGREHMLKWPQMEAIQHKAQWFFTKDSSKDDPYMLYAALHGGPNTMLVTHDELRDHSVLLGSQRETFRLWQRQCQIVPVRIFWSRGGIPTVKFKWPDKFDTCVQQTDACWHIPYEDHSGRPSYLLPNTWLCMRPSR